jgi:hypothetical protein
LRTTVERAILDAAPEIMIIDVEDPSEQDHSLDLASTAIPIVLGTKPVGAFDPATGCGAAFAADVTVS